MSISCLSAVYQLLISLPGQVESGLGAHEEEEGSDQGCDDET